jgi:hypothetical protein
MSSKSSMSGSTNILLTVYNSERMIKTRIKEWKLDKKHKEIDMRTAVALLANDRSRSWSTYSPRFRIRGRIVTYPEVLQYFRRKKINDPVAWIRSNRNDGFVASPEVKLLSPESVDDADNPPSPEEAESPADTSTAIVPASRPPPTDFQSRQQLINTPKTWDQSLVGSSIIHPAQHLAGDKAIWIMRDYCASYLESPRALTHREPQLHRLTTHAYFAHRMQNGIFSFLKGETIPAIANFEGAFNLTREIFRNDHPMSIAMLMSVICELKKNNLQTIVLQLVTHIRAVISMLHPEPHALTHLFSILETAGPDAANLAICAIRKALGFLSSHDHLDWKTLYLKERLCDCLYYMGERGEGADTRIVLLQEQEQKYGIYARNVLWTLTNVADDHLKRGEPWKAEKRFRDVLERSEKLEGYERANSRFKALEGLANTALVAAESVAAEGIMNNPAASQKDVWRKHQDFLLETVRLYDEAEGEAETWFEQDSPRRVRVVEKKAGIMKRIDPEHSRRMSASSRKDSWTVESPKIDLSPLRENP